MSGTRSEQSFAEKLTNEYAHFEKYEGADSVVSLPEMAEIVKANQTSKIIKSGFPTFDKIQRGFAPGELIAVSGPRKSGKTLFGQSLTSSFDANGIRSLWFSYEVTPSQFLERFPQLPVNSYTPKTMRAYSLDWVRDRIMEAMVKNSINIVFVDHLHYLLDLARINNISIEIGNVVRYLKRLAVELNLVVFVMCHLTKINPYQEPGDQDIRDSSFIAQESDMGLMIWRDRKKDSQGNVIGFDTAWLKICYDRRMGTIEKKIKLIKTNGLLVECAENVTSYSEGQTRSNEDRRYPT